MYSFSCSTVRGLRCRILRFIMRHTFSMGDRSGLQAGQSSTRTLLLRSHAVVKRAECGLALSCWNKQGQSMKKTLLGWQHVLLQNLYVPFSINGAFTDVQVPHATGTNTAPYHHRCWLLNFASITVRMVLFLFGPEDTTSTFSKNNLKCRLVRPTEHFSTWHQSISNELGPREVDGVSGCCWWMAFALHSRVLGCTYGCSDELYLLTVVFGSVLEPRWWYPLHIDVGFWCSAAWGIEGHGHSRLVFGLAAYMQWISPDSLNLLMILWTVDDEIPKFLAMVRWGTLFLTCLTIFSPQLSTKWWTSRHLCLWMTEQFIYPTHGTHLFPISLFTCGNFQTGVWWAFLNFLRLFGHLSQLLWNVLQPSNSKLMIIFPKK